MLSQFPQKRFSRIFIKLSGYVVYYMQILLIFIQIDIWENVVTLIFPKLICERKFTFSLKSLVEIV